MRILEEKELLSQCYSVKLRYCASRPPGLIEIIFDISNETFIALAIIIVNYVIAYQFNFLLSSCIKVCNVNFLLDSSDTHVKREAPIKSCRTRDSPFLKFRIIYLTTWHSAIFNVTTLFTRGILRRPDFNVRTYPGNPRGKIPIERKRCFSRTHRGCAKKFASNVSRLTSLRAARYLSRHR